MHVLGSVQGNALLSDYAYRSRVPVSAVCSMSSIKMLYYSYLSVDKVTTALFRAC
jgi:hypothetical protein